MVEEVEMVTRDFQAQMQHNILLMEMEGMEVMEEMGVMEVKEGMEDTELTKIFS